MKIKKVILSLALLLVLTACGKTDNANKGESEVENDTVRVAMSTELDGLNPTKITAGDTETVLDQIFDGLFDTDTDGKLVGDLAESYEVSDDGLVYTFKLKQGVKFHNGKDFKAEDVVYTYDLQAGLTSKEPLSTKFTIIKSVEAEDDYTVKVTLNERQNSFIYLTLKAILPKGYEDQDTNPVGTGPYKFVSYVPGEILKLEKFDDYHNKDHIAKIKNLEVIRMKDSQTMLMALQNGEIDVTPGLSSEEADQVMDYADIIEGPQNLVQTFALNNDFGPLKDPKVREALNMAIDRDELIKTVAGGRAAKVFSNFSPALPKYYNDLGEYYKSDKEAAKALLKEAGYENGFDLVCKVPSDYKFHVDTAEFIESELKQVGVNMSIEPIEFSTWIDKVYKGREFEATIIGFVGYLDPDQILGRYVSDNKSNFINFNSAMFDEEMSLANTAKDENEVIEHYKNAQKALVEDHASVFLQDPNIMLAMRKGVSGLKLYPIQKRNFEDLVFTK